jgi:hypothetical protein
MGRSSELKAKLPGRAMLSCLHACLSARARYSGGGSNYIYIYELAQPQIIFNPIFPL